MGRSFIVAQMPLVRRRRSIKGTAGRRMGYSGGCADGDCHRVDATKPAQLQRQNGTFPRSLPGERPLEPGEVTASENWKVRRAHAGARRSLAVAPAPLRAGATGASGARAPPAPPRTAWPPPYRPGLPDSAPPSPGQSQPIRRRSPPPGPRSPAPGRRVASQWEAEPSAQCALPAPSRLRARKANPTRRGRRSGPTACRRAPPAARRRRLLPPGSGVLSQPESPVLRPGCGERASERAR